MQLFDYPPRTVSALIFPETMDDLLFHYFVFLFRLMTFSGLPGVIAASTNIKHLALHLAGKFVLIRLNEPVHIRYIGRLKMLKAFFKISRSISSSFTRF